MVNDLSNEYNDFININKSEELHNRLKSYLKLRDDNGKTILMYDAEHGVGNLTKFFINNYEDAGIEENEMEEFIAAKDAQDVSALMHSIHEQNSIVRELVTQFATSTARENKDYEKEVMQATDNKGQTPLIYAVRFGKDTYDTSAMIGYADVNAKDTDGKTALNYALARGDSAMVEIVHKKGGKFFLPEDEGKEYSIEDAEQAMTCFSGHQGELVKVAEASGVKDKYFNTLMNSEKGGDEDKDLVENFLNNKQGIFDLEKIKLAFDNDKTNVNYKNKTKESLREKQADLGREIRKDHFARVTNALGITKEKVGNRAELIAEQEKIGEVLRSGGMTVAGKVIDATYKAVGKKPRLGKGK